MSTKLEDVLLSPRQCAAGWLAIHARELAGFAKQTNSTTLLVFACLEARSAIEQLWFDLLMFIYGGAMSKELFEKCQRRRDGFLAAIREAEPRYRQLSQFAAIVAHLDGRAPCAGISWDLKRLKRLWQELSRYCHAQAHPVATLDDSKWVSTGYALVEELSTYFQQEMSRGAPVMMRPDDMTPEARMIWDDFAARKIDEKQVRIRLNIVRP